MLLVIFSLLPLATLAIPWSSSNVLFGTAIKNGPIPPNIEWPVFNHTCITPPCVITQIHVPSIYPGSGCPWDWEDGVLRVYVDGESTPTVQLTLLQIASVGANGAKGDSHDDISPYSAELFGKNAQTGGVWTTIRIPFQTTIRLTLQQASTCSQQGVAWIIIRGVENLTIRMSEIDLPSNAKLYQSTISGQVFAPQEFIPLASSPSSTSGMLLYTFLDATSADPNYLEGCFHITDQFGTTFLSSGTEDYFLSASYFDEGVFSGTQAGLTYKGPGGDFSMYKTHTRDLIPFHNGMQFVWRNNEDGASCPNHWGKTGTNPIRQPTTGPLNLTSVVFYYAW